MNTGQMYANGVGNMTNMPNQQMGVSGMSAPANNMMGSQGPMGVPQNQGQPNQMMASAMQQQPGQMAGMGAPFNPQQQQQQQQWFQQQTQQSYYNPQGILFFKKNLMK